MRRRAARSDSAPDASLDAGIADPAAAPARSRTWIVERSIGRLSWAVLIGGLVIALAVASVCVIVIVLLSSKVRLGLTRFADFAEWATIALLLPLAIIAGGWF